MTVSGPERRVRRQVNSVSNCVNNIQSQKTAREQILKYLGRGGQESEGSFR